LEAALKDDSKYVRIAAAEALAQYGALAEAKNALAVLRGLVPSSSNDVFVQIYALSAIDALGKKAAPLLEVVRAIQPQEETPDNRYNSYAPRLVEHIRAELGDAGPAESGAAPKAKGKGKRKAK
jgi:HEAT repeat protein